MIHENDPTAKDKTMNAAFRDSMRIATKWNSLVNRIFGPCEIGISRRHRLPRLYASTLSSKRTSFARNR